MSLLPNLFKPINVGGLELGNRIVMPAMHTHFSNPSGEVTEQLVSYYARRAKGGVGLLIIEATGFDSKGQGLGNQLMIDKDGKVGGLSKLVEAVKNEGAKIAIQLYHAGLRANAVFTKTQPVGPSKMEVSGSGIASRDLSKSEIAELIRAFSEAARRAKDAGFDAIELHGAHGYLLNQFLSPLYNRRTDEYGGNQRNRTEFLYRIVKCVREAVGKGYPIFCKIPGDEGVEEGLSLKDAITVAERLEEAGVDAFDVSCGLSETLFSTMPMGSPQGYFVHLAEEIKRHINLPVMTVGGFKEPLYAEQVLQEGRADLIGMGRALLADPDIPRKALQGRFDEIRPCIGCNWCITQVGNALPVVCSVNPLLGRERQRVVKATCPKRILVIGGGTAGMEAAICCKERGHDVLLMEKEDDLGGLMNIASVAPQKKEIRGFCEYLTRSLIRSKVKITKGKEVTSDVVKEIGPDAVVVATGSKQIFPEFLEGDRGNIVLASEILSGRSKPGNNVVVVGGGHVGLETADFLSDQGIGVTVVEQLPQVGADVPPRILVFLVKRLLKKKVTIKVRTKVIGIDKSGVLAELPGKQEILSGDQVIIAVGMKSENRLVEALNRNIPDFKEIYIIGDAIKPRRILEAVKEASEVADLISASQENDHLSVRESGGR